MKRELASLVGVCMVVGVFLPLSRAEAQLGGLINGLPFGGLVNYTVPCTCPGSIGNLWIYFTPFWFSSVPATGAVVYVPYTSQLYAWYHIGVPGTYHLGSYTPGVQACWMLLPPPATGCFPLPAVGVINQVGTSQLF